MSKTELIQHLINLIEYCKCQLVLVDTNIEMSFEEKRERKEKLRYDLRRANSYYYQLTSEYFNKVA